MLESEDAAGLERPEEGGALEAFERLSDKERSRAVEALLARLPDPMRETVTLRFYEEMDLAQIAEATGVPVGTVKSRLHHAIARIRTMAREGGLDETA